MRKIPSHIVMRADGEDIGEYTFFACYGENDWGDIEDMLTDEENPVEIMRLRVLPEPEKKMAYPFQWCLTHNQSICTCEDEENLEGECEEA
jgi:hypothetical protein